MYTFQTIARIIKGNALNTVDNRPIKHLGVDTRKFNQGEQLLFFAIRGANNDGHQYLAEAFRKGCRTFVLEDSDVNPWLSDEQAQEANIIRVNDSIHALQALAAHHRQQFDIPVIGITGSNGKTIVKEWLYQLLYTHYNIHRSPRSYNSRIGLPLSVWELTEAHELAIFEAGISQPGEMVALKNMIRPTTGLFTNIGQAHQAGFDSLQQKIHEKLNLFPHCRELYYCCDYTAIEEAIQAKRGEGFFTDAAFTPHTWSKTGKDTELSLSTIRVEGHTTEIEANRQGHSLRLTIPYADQASIENAVHCLLLGLNKDIPALVLQEGLKHLSPVEMRMEIKRGINGSTLINDTYNSDLLSLQIALDLLNQQNQHERQTVILSDILQSGRDEAALYRDVGEVLQSKHIDRLIGIGPALQRQQQQIPVKNTIYPSTEAFLKDLPDFPFEQEAILIKGARQFRFEQITSRLQEKAHQTVLAINLQALIHNLNVYRSLLNPATRVMVMVKAFSYGSGTYEVANALQFHRADYLAVAYADEGIALRKAGITLPIMVLNPEPQAFHELVAYELEPEIYSVSLLRRFSQYLQTYHPAISVPVHLNLDTGMHRLGIDEAAIPDLLDELSNSSALRVASIFSHPAASENPAEDEFTQDQIRLYERMSEQIQGVLGYRVMRHMLNSNGIVRFPEAHYDMVRLGLGFYGIDATGQVKDRLQTPATLKTTISQIKELRPGDTVGYGRQGKVAAPMTLATIAIGYADGFSRAFGQGRGYVLINGQKAPVVGDVCMDMTMVDVTNTGAVEGDAVIVFGEEPAIEDLARWSHTIPYEILTNISQRVKRIYLNE